MSHGRYVKDRVAFGIRGKRGRRTMKARAQTARARRHPKEHIPIRVLERRRDRLDRIVKQRRAKGER